MLCVCVSSQGKPSLIKGNKVSDNLEKALVILKGELSRVTHRCRCAGLGGATQACLAGRQPLAFTRYSTETDYFPVKLLLCTYIAPFPWVTKASTDIKRDSVWSKTLLKGRSLNLRYYHHLKSENIWVESQKAALFSYLKNYRPKRSNLLFAASVLFVEYLCLTKHGV